MHKKQIKIRLPTEIQQRAARIRWWEIRLAMLFFNGKCSGCGKSIITHRIRPRPHTLLSFIGFLYHHLEYRDGEPRRKDYPKGYTGLWDYKEDVLPFVEKYHDEFLLLCGGCHDLVEKIYRKCKNHPERLACIMLAVKLTRT